MRVIAVDWSGAAVGAGRRIWLAEAATRGQLTRLESGRSRDDLSTHLLRELTLHERVAVGLDFAFAFPCWFMDRLGVTTGSELWRHVVEHGEQWLADCAPPFWGRGKRPRPDAVGAWFRRTELDAPRTAGIGPKSIFQIGGAGAVGTGSIRGMPLLAALHDAGAHVWPFDAPGWPLVLEIYPRLLTGPVVKTSSAARAAYLDERFPRLAETHRRAATESEDAFDAAVSALVMLEHASELRRLAEETDPQLRLEGRIWHPCQLSS